MKQGDWVTNEEGYLFFIEECNTVIARIGCFVKKTEDSEIEIEKNIAYPEELTLAGLEGYSEEEITFLINLALDTNDKKWFDELIARLENNKDATESEFYVNNGR